MSKIRDLEHNPRNPRRITDRKLAMLRKAIERFGDLGGVVFNSKTQHLIGGHQRTKIFDPETAVVIDARYDPPTKNGTVAEGHILWKGERHRYREVQWDETTEIAANLAANKGAGEFDMDAVTAWIGELEAADFDLDLTMFEADELNVVSEGMAEGAPNTEGHLNIAPEDSSESSSGSQEQHLAFGRIRLPISDEEAQDLLASIEQYKTQYGSLYGYVSHLLDGHQVTK